MSDERAVSDLRPLWDLAKPCANPHKGWYHHYYDNGAANYQLRSDDDLLLFPGMDHLYIRLSWRHFEPLEGVFDWHWIDELVETWVPRGLRISVRVTSKETNETYATPAWVRDAGAQGNVVPSQDCEMWVPLYDDPVFLAKLAAFHKAFGARYAAQPWLAYVDIGSIGTWGEGHEWPGGQRASIDTIAHIIDLHVACYPGVTLVIPDEIAHFDRPVAEEDQIRALVESRGVCWRDDTPLVGYFVRTHAQTFSVVRPDYFARTYRQRPVILETDHYPIVKRQGNWKGHNGSEVGADILRGALGLMHATYLGYHGHADAWLADNPGLAVELLNQCGYWYAPATLAMPATIRPGETIRLAIAWDNRGVAQAYHRYDLELQLSGPDDLRLRQDGSDNRTWLDGRSTEERYELAIPPSLRAGRYTVSLRLWDPLTARPVELALHDVLRDATGFYRIGSVDCGIIPGSSAP